MDGVSQGLRFELLYHPGKANIVADALSRKRMHISAMMVKKLELIEKLRDMNLGMQLERIQSGAVF